MRHPEEEKLDFLVGSWTSLDKTFAGPDGPGGTSQGRASYEWELGGKWLNYHFRTELPGLGPYEVKGGVVYDRETGLYKAFAINTLGKLLTYEGRWESDRMLAFGLVFPRPEADTRVSYIRESDGVVRLTSERPGKEGGRELYFETVMSRAE